MHGDAHAIDWLARAIDYAPAQHAHARDIERSRLRANLHRMQPLVEDPHRVMEPRRDRAIQRRRERARRILGAVAIMAIDLRIAIIIDVVLAPVFARWQRRHARPVSCRRIGHTARRGADDPGGAAIRAMLAAVSAPERERHEQQQFERSATGSGRGAALSCALSPHGLPFRDAVLTGAFLQPCRQYAKEQALSPPLATAPAAIVAAVHPG
jgi:hypothetical protein